MKQMRHEEEKIVHLFHQSKGTVTSDYYNLIECNCIISVGNITSCVLYTLKKCMKSNHNLMLSSLSFAQNMIMAVANLHNQQIVHVIPLKMMLPMKRYILFQYH